VISIKSHEFLSKIITYNQEKRNAHICALIEKMMNHEKTYQKLSALFEGKGTNPLPQAA